MLSAIFLKKPQQWGLRGDPFLWAAFKEKIGHLPLPTTENELKLLLENTFYQITNTHLTNSGTVFIKSFSYGGISSGTVSLEFWHKQGIPLLLQNYRDKIKRLP